MTNVGIKQKDKKDVSYAILIQTKNSEILVWKETLEEVKSILDWWKDTTKEQGVIFEGNIKIRNEDILLIDYQAYTFRQKNLTVPFRHILGEKISFITLYRKTILLFLIAMIIGFFLNYENMLNSLELQKEFVISWLNFYGVMLFFECLLTLSFNSLKIMKYNPHVFVKSIKQKPNLDSDAFTVYHDPLAIGSLGTNIAFVSVFLLAATNLNLSSALADIFVDLFNKIISLI